MQDLDRVKRWGKAVIWVAVLDLFLKVCGIWTITVELFHRRKGDDLGLSDSLSGPDERILTLSFLTLLWALPRLTGGFGMIRGKRWGIVVTLACAAVSLFTGVLAVLLVRDLAFQATGLAISIFSGCVIQICIREFKTVPSKA